MEDGTYFQTNLADDPRKKYIIYRRLIEQYYVFYHVNVHKTQKLANFQTFFLRMDEHYTLHILRLNLLRATLIKIVIIIYIIFIDWIHNSHDYDYNILACCFINIYIQAIVNCQVVIGAWIGKKKYKRCMHNLCVKI